MTEVAVVKQLLPSGVVKWLESTDYFTAPASMAHHGNFTGGLVKHSYQVYLTLTDLTEKLNLKWDRPESPAIIGLLHDVCKIGLYIPTETGWAYNPVHSSEHGSLSARMVAEHMYTTWQEQLCIRYHMGAYESTDIGEKNYSQAVKDCENVLWTHTADMIASQIKGV